MHNTLKNRIGNYELIEVLGNAGHGTVFKARRAVATDDSVASGEVVALKILRLPPDDDQARAQFEAQAEILKRLANPHIIRYRDSFTWHSGEWDEAQCLVTDYLAGETLASRLGVARLGLAWPEVKHIFEQCLNGLIYAAQQGVSHRNLKPSNIFLTRDGSAQVFNFDIIRIGGASQRSTLVWQDRFDYMAPDFITEPDFYGDQLSDIFSLGTCICQALTGKLPFEKFGDKAYIGYLKRWRNASAPPELAFRPDAYRVLANARSFVAHCLNLQRSQRYSSFGEMLADFQRIRRRLIQHVGKDAYELRRLLGRGGFGEVFEGVRVGDGRPVAIKHLFADRQSARFIKEAEMLRRYSHPFLVQYIDFIEVVKARREKQYFLILELLEGMPAAGLCNRLQREGRLDPAEAIPLFMNYLEALSFLHGHAYPLIHRDIKPLNLYAPTGHPEKAKVFDLGVAHDVLGVVISGGIPGTLDYMAPEFAAAGAGRGSPQTDIYSLGLCLYESLVGQTAYPRLPPDIDSAWSIFQERSLARPEADFRARVFRMYPDLKGLVRKAIDFQTDARYANAAVMRQDLEKVLRRLHQPEDVLPP